MILIFGADDGLVSERAANFARTILGDSGDPFAHIRLDASTLSEDPARLADEAHAISLFGGGSRLISVRLSGNWSILPALEPLVASPPSHAWVVVTAGELRKTSPVRKFFESTKTAAAIACYADGPQEIERMIVAELKAASLGITADARAALKALLGGDRLASRAEIAKLMLYAAGSKEITIEDVRAAVGDASALEVDETVDAAASGDAESFARLYQRQLAAGAGDYAIIGAALRHFQYLHRARSLFEQGTDAESAVGPQFYGPRKSTIAKQISGWPLGRIERALTILDRAIADSRVLGAIPDEIVGQAMLMIATLAPARRAPARA